MDKFWKWMEEKDYSDLKCEKLLPVYNYFAYDDMPKQMLIGYMIEYIRDKIGYLLTNKLIKSDIWIKKDIYKELEDIIKLIDEE
jgi:hypothetical protein